MLKHLFTGLAFFVSLNALALTQDDITFPDAEKVQNHPLVLNGIGFRKATFLKIKVYAAGLYLEKKSQNSDEIIKSTGSKKVVLKFLRNVSVEDVRGAWEKSFKSLCETEKCDSIQADIQKFKDAMEDVKEGEFMSYSFSPDSIEIEIRGVKKAQIPAGLLTQLVLKTWIGPNPPNSELKEGLLGL
jgi:hypothetical protein